MTIAPLRSGDQVTAGYRVPASRRGVLAVGPAELERRDLLGLASSRLVAVGATELTVAPQTFELPMPALGHGVLGRHLLALSQRVGPGEFHSLRDYVVGDEPRSIHWRASARSEELKVRQHEAQGVRRCIVVLDRDGDAYPAPVTDAEADVFERAITAAGSLVLSADRVGLTTRFVTGGGIDLRGPDVAANTLRLLAPITIGPALGELERDPSEGLGLVVVVTSSPRPTHGVGPNGSSTRRSPGSACSPAGSQPGRLNVDASSIEAFRTNWGRLAGTGGLHRIVRDGEIVTEKDTEVHGVNGPATSLERDLTATGALALFSFSVAFGFVRVFSGWDFLLDLGLLVVLGHGVSFLLRRAHVEWLDRHPRGVRPAHVGARGDAVRRDPELAAPDRRHVEPRRTGARARPRPVPDRDRAGDLRHGMGDAGRLRSDRHRVHGRRIRLPRRGER